MDLEPTVNSDPRRILPSVDRLIRSVMADHPALPEWAVRRAARDRVDGLREELIRGESRFDGSEAALASLQDEVVGRAQRISRRHPRRVINATGVVLHTNLGRAPLARAAADAVARVAAGYSDLELDLETGRRGSRMGALEEKLCALSGAEAAHVVNNCAAGLLLALNTLALGRAAIVSRGELVEIGGSFRVPAIMERAGVRLVEVGTTNRTHLRDYEAAIDAETALLLKVHRSNFEQSGFVTEVGVEALAGLAREKGLPLVEDLGSGSLTDLRPIGLPEESFVPGRLALGVDVLSFSGDKLLGGPQAGILLGQHDAIDAMRRNPLARALRVDKLTVAALDATLDLLLDPARSVEIPVVAGLSASEADLEPRAGKLRERLAPLVPAGYALRIERSEAAVGGGSLPEHRLAGVAVVLEGPRLARLAGRLRAAPTPVLARVRDDALWLDVRTLADDELDAVADAVAFALA